MATADQMPITNKYLYNGSEVKSGTQTIKSSNCLAVVGIDFGTTYSGYAFSFQNEYKNDRTKIYSSPRWPGGEEILSQKTPTCVLFDKQGNFNSFGYEAETHYADLAVDEDHTGWQFFKYFKMELYKIKRITDKIMLSDDQGNEKPALTVFAAAIKYLKEHAEDRIRKNVSFIRESDLFWVLTVPAIWDDRAKQFMERSAELAGISKDLMTIALEPECAAVFCKELEVNRSREDSLGAFDPDSSFVVVDIGGGTVDVTTHQVMSNHSLREIAEPSGGPWGGTTVDDSFNKLMNDLFTEPVMDKFKEESKVDYLDLCRRFEKKKRSLTKNSRNVYISLPLALLILYEKMTGRPFEKSIHKTAFEKTVRVKVDKLVFDSKLFQGMFDTSKAKIVSHLRNLLSLSELKRTNTLLLVGGFSEAETVREAIENSFHDKRIIWPQEAELAISKGAVMYGFTPQSIGSRIMRFTYGIAIAVPFDQNIHPQKKKVIRYGRAKCEDVFKIFFERGKEVVPGKTSFQHRFNCPYRNASTLIIEIYRSTSITPEFVDDPDTKKVGDLELNLTDQDGNEIQQVDVEMMFGDTQLEVRAKEYGALKGVGAKFNFLS